MRKRLLAVSLVLAMAFTISCSSGDDNDDSNAKNSSGGGGSACVGGIVPIGTQTWQKCNLNVEATGTGVATNSKCYNNNPSNCVKYGRLYDWATAMALPESCNSSSCLDKINSPHHRGICPQGWHIPSDADWDVLMTAIGDFSTAGTKLKATSGWNSYGGIAGTDNFGFSALPGSYVRSNGNFGDVGEGRWWSASEYDANFAYDRVMRYYNEIVSYGNYAKIGLFSVRCLQD